jgi:hypothetical protein
MIDIKSVRLKGQCHEIFCFWFVNDTDGKIAAGINDTGGNSWQQYQAADTLK